MTIIAADDDTLALNALCEVIAQAAPDARVEAFAKPSEMLAFARSHRADVAFLEARVCGTSGAELAKRLREHSPDVNIIFVAKTDEYAGEAMALHASGYLRKPATAEKVGFELSDLRRPPARKPAALLRVQCFGNFDVYTPDGAKLHFERSKASELLAYLVYRSGASCSTREIAAALFEDAQYDKKQQSYMQKIISSMMQTLRRAGAEAVIVKRHNSLSVAAELVDCDYYRFTEFDEAAVNAYRGEFMSQYAWAELVIGYLNGIRRKQPLRTDEKT